MTKLEFRYIVLLVAAAALTVFIAYQIPLPVKMDVGGNNENYTRGFYEVESIGGRQFRWTNGDGRVLFPDVGRAVPIGVVVDSYAWRQDDHVYTATVTVNGTEVGTISKAGWREWRFVISDTAILRADELVVGFHSTPFIHSELFPGSEDHRPYGVGIESVELEPQLNGWSNLLTIPSAPQVLFAIAFALGVYALWRSLGVRAQVALCVALAALVIFATIIVFDRVAASQRALFAALAVGATIAVAVWGARIDKWRFAAIALPLSVMLVAFWLRAHATVFLPVEGDDGIYMQAAEQYAQAIRVGDWARVIQYESGIEHPIFNVLLFAFASLARDFAPLHLSSVEAMRLVAVLFGTLQVGLIAILNPLAGWFLAIQTTEIKFTSMAYLEALPALTAAISVISFEKFRRTSQTHWMWISALALGAAGASKFIYAVVGFAILPFLLWEQRRQLKLILIYGLVVMFSFLALDPYLWANPVGRMLSMFSFHASFSTREYVQELARPWWYNLVVLAVPAKIYSPPNLYPSPFVLSWDGAIYALGLLGIPSLVRRSRLYLAWLVAGVVFVSLWEAKWEQYAMVIATPLCLSAGYGLADLMQWLRSRFSRVELFARFKVKPTPGATGN